MGSTICTAGFPSAAIASSCFTARCDSIWYGFFIATLLFSAKENSLSAYQGWERGVATFYDLTGIPIAKAGIMYQWPFKATRTPLITQMATMPQFIASAGRGSV